MKKEILSLFTVALLNAGYTQAAPVKIVMNGTSPTMTLVNKATGEAVSTGDPTGTIYTLDLASGDYVLTAYGKDGETVNGTIVLTVEAEATEHLEEGQEAGLQTFSVLTCTAYATNQGWTVGDDYTISVEVATREGRQQTITLGQSVTAGRKTFLALNGNSYYAELTPSEAHMQEGYMSLYKQGTLTGGINVQGAIPMGYDYTVTLPADAGFFLGMKFAHYIPYREVQPLKQEQQGSEQVLTFRLADRQVYNYRTWQTGKLTQAGYFTMNADAEKRPELHFTQSDYDAYDPSQVNHTPQSNGGYETGNIFVNVNAQGHLRLDVGDTFMAHAMRSWELTDNQTNNYFIEPDFHYTVLTLDGQPSTGVIEVAPSGMSRCQRDPITGQEYTNLDPWATIRAVGKGTALVLVTYDAIGLNQYKSGTATKDPYMGGQYWGAIWPENTAVYVVSVGEPAPDGLQPNMLINEAYNAEKAKTAGNFVDAEHDVFYYLDTEAGATYTFTPEGAATVEMARPTVGERMATYTGFGTEGVTRNDDGSYTLLLSEGRTIVRLSDAQGRATYQVLTARQCHRDIVNASRPGSQIFQPGDKVKIQYSGLYHPANKMAGIYNMSAYVTYNGTPNGTSLILSPNQYQFGSSASAQAVTIDLPTDYADSLLVMDEGVIQVHGYGDPIGNHRNTSITAGRSANFTAVAHDTYFGQLPPVRIPLSPMREFTIRPVCNVEGATFTFSLGDRQATDQGDGTFLGTYGTYTVTAACQGYRCYRSTFTIADDAEGEQVVNIEMEPASTPLAWDGSTLTEPAQQDGVYQIGTGAELAWLAALVNGTLSDYSESSDYSETSDSSEGFAIPQNRKPRAVLTADIDLADYDWTPIGGTKKTTAFQGRFDGQGHSVSGLYINRPSDTHQALFGYTCGNDNEYADVKDTCIIRRLTVSGEVRARQYVAGIVAYQDNFATVDRCVNHADVYGSYAHCGGVVALQTAWSATCRNSYNTGRIETPSNAGGVVGTNFMVSVVENVFSLGEVVAKAADGASVGGNSTKGEVRHAYATRQYRVTEGNTLVTEEQMQSGEVAWLLGEAFGQTIGEDEHPVLDGLRVFKVLYSVDQSETVDSLFTNGQLPTTLWQGYVAEWHTEDGTVVTEVTGDTVLYVTLTTDGISDATRLNEKVEMRNEKFYDLQGRRVATPQRSAEGRLYPKGLKKGQLYVKRGRKYIIHQ